MALNVERQLLWARTSWLPAIVRRSHQRRASTLLLRRREQASRPPYRGTQSLPSLDAISATSDLRGGRRQDESVGAIEAGRASTMLALVVVASTRVIVRPDRARSEANSRAVRSAPPVDAIITMSERFHASVWSACNTSHSAEDSRELPSSLRTKDRVSVNAREASVGRSKPSRIESVSRGSRVTDERKRDSSSRPWPSSRALGVEPSGRRHAAPR